jgi:hypothetical protein
MNMVLGNVTESVTCVAVDEETEEGTFKVNNRLVCLMEWRLIVEMRKTVENKFDMLFVRGDGVILVSPLVG